jgi:hypothetical protein
MTSAFITRFCEQRPFVPFSIYLADGREHHAPHSDFIAAGEYAATIHFHHANGEMEVIDAALIVSFRTLQPADI